MPTEDPSNAESAKKRTRFPLLATVIKIGFVTLCLNEFVRGVSVSSKQTSQINSVLSRKSNIESNSPRRRVSKSPKRKAKTRNEDNEEEDLVEIDDDVKEGAEHELIDPENDKPLNIVFLYGDDWRHDSIGSAKASIVQTPFLDDLATKGIKFLHNCVTTSVCWISRATLYTGLYLARHKSDYPHKPRWLKGWKNTWPKHLKDRGYHLGHVGKWHFEFNEDVQKAFEFGRPYYGAHWYEPPEVEKKIHATKRNEVDAIDFLKTRPKDKPFMLSVCFFAPHSVDGTDEQYYPQPESMALYQDESVEIPVSSTQDAWNKLPYFFDEQMNEARRRWHIRFDQPEKHQRMMKNYFRLITEIDQSSKAIYDEIEKQGLLDNTMFIFTTDNGLYHSEHQIAGKWYPHQESIRVPLIIKDPRMPSDKIGTTNDDFTLNIDLASTILHAANVKPPEVMQGRDIADLYLKSDPEWREEFYYEHPMHLDKNIIPESTALVRKNFKYLTWPDFNFEQLFNLDKDPLELQDIINETEYSQVLAEMRVRHDELKEKVKKPGRIDSFQATTAKTG